MANIDYIGLLDYLEHNRGITYKDPKKASDEEKARLFEVSEKGKKATGTLKKIARLCSERFGIDKCMPVSWLDATNTKTGQYLWAQMKFSDNDSVKNKASISIFVEMVSDTLAAFRISLEFKDDGSNESELNLYHSHLDKPLNTAAGLVYVSGSNEWGRPYKIEGDNEQVKAKLASGEYKKVQISKYIYQKKNQTDKYFEKEILTAVEALMPYYKMVVGVKVSFSLKRYAEVIDSYKNNFDRIWPNESNKWNIVEIFRNSWDMQCPEGTFADMLDNALAKIGNLVNQSYGSPIEMMAKLAREDEITVKNLFADLYDETASVSIEERIANFKLGCDELIKAYQKKYNSKENHNQKNDAISVYLWLNYPDKYYLYRGSVVDDFAYYLKADYLRGKKGPASQKVFYDDVKRLVLQDDEMLNMLKNKLADGYFENHFELAINTLIVDIGFYVHYYMWEPVGYGPLDGMHPYTKEDWLELLQNEKIRENEGIIKTLKRLLDIGTIASCKELDDTYGGGINLYNNAIRFLGEYVYQAKGCPLHEKQYWPISCYGRNDKETKTFIYKLRGNLVKALNEEKIQELLDKVPLFENEVDNTEHDTDDGEGETVINYPLNQILYGPPGTGKTYNAMAYALAIIEGTTVEAVQTKMITNYKQVKDRYDNLIQAKRIAFTTFHQSYGYEDFVEGIKAIPQGNNILYKAAPGVFRQFCESEDESEVSTVETSQLIDPNAKVWCYIPGGDYSDSLEEDCFENNCVRIGWKNHPKIIDSNTGNLSGMARGILLAFQNDIKKGDIILCRKGKYTISGIAKVTGDYEFIDDDDAFPRSRAVEWLAKNIDLNIASYNDNKRLDRKTIYNLYRINGKDVEEMLDKLNNAKQSSSKTVTNNKVFIIDEINRGNISKIFGELITLIEDSKRASNDEEASVILPYSNEQFSVPNNVYIIGTMNTADRSLTQIDTALRRRFEFVEMMPKPDLLPTITVDNVTLDINKMLTAINKRIAYLFDREHTIGHAYFIKLNDMLEAKDNDGNLLPAVKINAMLKAELEKIFAKKIIPLLQEYFFDDYEKIRLVLGDNAKSNENFMFITKTSCDLKSIFGEKVDDSLDEEKYDYSINSTAFTNVNSYKEISKDI